MITCIVLYLAVIVFWILRKKDRIPKWIDRRTERYVLMILFLCNTLGLTVFLIEENKGQQGMEVSRNTYGAASRIEEYELTAEGVLSEESIRIEIEPREYTGEEIKELFQKVFDELDRVILGENQSFDRVEQDLNLVTSLKEYPVEIQWELDSYELMNIEGRIVKEELDENGTLIQLQGKVTYGEQQAVYVRAASIYPAVRTEAEEFLDKIESEIQKIESKTRGDESFQLPEQVEGVALQWSRKSEGKGYYILFLGVVLAAFMVYHKQEEKKQTRKKQVEELVRDYPSMVSKFSMLLETGMTTRKAWEKVVQNYEVQKEQIGARIVYEEMCAALLEMQGGISEAEAYERFGRRCRVTSYVKLGTLLSQNLKKGSRGLVELLRMEAIQAFEERKSTAKKLGEEASTKLLVPMLGMLMVVLIMVMIPAFLSMQF